MFQNVEAQATPAEALKQATQAAHTQLEALVDAKALLDGSLGLEGYARLILGNYHWHQLIEPALLAAFADDDDFDYRPRRKLPALEADLACLGLHPQRLRAELSPPEPASQAQALGLLYVIEGATLGGSVIRRALKQQPDIKATGALHYYGLYGEELGPRWRATRELLNARLSRTEDLEQACRFAALAFELASRCFAPQDKN